MISLPLSAATHGPRLSMASERGAATPSAVTASRLAYWPSDVAHAWVARDANFTGTWAIRASMASRLSLACVPSHAAGSL